MIIDDLNVNGRRVTTKDVSRLLCMTNALAYYNIDELTRRKMVEKERIGQTKYLTLSENGRRAACLAREMIQLGSS